MHQKENKQTKTIFISKALWTLIVFDQNKNDFVDNEMRYLHEIDANSMAPQLMQSFFSAPESSHQFEIVLLLEPWNSKKIISREWFLKYSKRSFEIE